MTCHAYWSRQVNSRIKTKWPNVRIVMARAYFRPAHLDIGVLPPITPDPGDPIKQMAAILAEHHDPDADFPGIVMQYHPKGGVSWAFTPLG